MASLLIAFAVLIAGYFLYGRVTDRIFASDDRQTPAFGQNKNGSKGRKRKRAVTQCRRTLRDSLCGRRSSLPVCMPERRDLVFTQKD